MTFKEKLLKFFPNANYDTVRSNLCPHELGLGNDLWEQCRESDSLDMCDICWEELKIDEKKDLKNEK